MGIGVSPQFAPLTKRAFPASGMLQIGTAEYLLLDDPAIKGYSGGPVFQSLPAIFSNDRPAQFIGVVMGYFPRAQADMGGQFAMLIPAHKVLEVIRK
jgi:hypothetical protein